MRDVVPLSVIILFIKSVFFLSVIVVTHFRILIFLLHWAKLLLVFHVLILIAEVLRMIEALLLVAVKILVLVSVEILLLVSLEVPVIIPVLVLMEISIVWSILSFSVVEVPISSVVPPPSVILSISSITWISAAAIVVISAISVPAASPISFSVMLRRLVETHVLAGPLFRFLSLRDFLFKLWLIFFFLIFVISRLFGRIFTLLLFKARLRVDAWEPRVGLACCRHYLR